MLGCERAGIQIETRAFANKSGYVSVPRQLSRLKTRSFSLELITKSFQYIGER